MLLNPDQDSEQTTTNYPKVCWGISQGLWVVRDHIQGCSAGRDE